jgi:hypothetical protein
MGIMKNIHILRTNKTSRLQRFFNGDDEIEFELSPKDSHFNKGVHIYITSDEEIKEGDWTFDGENPYKWTSGDVEDCLYNQGTDNHKGCKKIIITTDETLIEDDVQTIDDEFLEWFVKNPTCEFVHTYNDKVVGYEYDNYTIITPIEEEEIECNTCGYLMGLLPDNSIYVCYNSECTSFYDEIDESIMSEEEPKQVICRDKFDRVIQDGYYVDVQQSGIHKVYTKEDGQLYFTPYGKEEMVSSYFSNDLTLTTIGTKLIMDLKKEIKDKKQQTLEETKRIHSEGEGRLQRFIDQFGDGELGELDPNEWNALEFLEWLKLNNYEIIKK